MITGIIVVLLAIMAAGIVVLKQDAKQRRIDQQVLTALGTPAGQTAQLTSIRRQSQQYQMLAQILGYRSDAKTWPMGYTVLIAVVVATVASAIFHMAVSWLVAIVLSVFVGLFVIRSLLTWQRDRYADRLLRQMPDCIEVITSAVKAGLPVAEAFKTVSGETAAPTKDEFAIVIQDIRLGRPPEDAVRTIFDRTGVAEYAMLSVTLAVQSKSGGRLAETLQTLGDAIRERVTLAGRAKALAGEAKFSARILACIPFLLGTYMYFISPGSMDPLFFDSRGRFLFAIGLTSLMLGILLMRRMIKKGTAV